MDIVSAGKNQAKVRKAIVAGFFMNAAKKDPQEGYKTMVEGQPVFIHPSSALFNKVAGLVDGVWCGGWVCWMWWTWSGDGGWVGRCGKRAGVLAGS